MSDRITIPYRPGYTPTFQWPAPYNGPWPRSGAAPHSADAYFTNLDARLRPQSLLVPSSMAGTHFIESDRVRVEVTRWNFPQLHQQFMAMQQQAGLTDKPYRLFIGREVAGKASIERNGNRREISIDLGVVNRSDWGSLQFWLGHELGHAWQYVNKEQRIPMREPRVEPQQRYEVTADVFAMCMASDREGILRGMRGLSANGGGGSYPSRDVRQNAARVATMGDCVSMGLSPGVPPLLRAPQRSK